MTWAWAIVAKARKCKATMDFGMTGGEGRAMWGCRDEKYAFLYQIGGARDWLWACGDSLFRVKHMLQRLQALAPCWVTQLETKSIKYSLAPRVNNILKIKLLSGDSWQIASGCAWDRSRPTRRWNATKLAYYPEPINGKLWISSKFITPAWIHNNHHLQGSFVSGNTVWLCY